MKPNLSRGTSSEPCCELVQERVSAHIDGEATLDGATAQHIACCSCCKDFESALSFLSKSFEPLRVTAAEDLPDLWSRIELRTRGLRRIAPPSWSSRLGAALAGAAAVGVLFFATRSAPSEPGDTLERSLELLAREAGPRGPTQRLARIPEIRLALALIPTEEPR